MPGAALACWGTADPSGLACRGRARALLPVLSIPPGHRHHVFALAMASRTKTPLGRFELDSPAYQRATGCIRPLGARLLAEAVPAQAVPLYPDGG